MKKKNKKPQRYFAYVWARGLVELTKNRRQMPEGALLIAHGAGKKFKDQVDVVCRHAYKPRGALLANGLPESDYEHFLKWHEWAFVKRGYCRSYLRRRVEEAVAAVESREAA